MKEQLQEVELKFPVIILIVTLTSKVFPDPSSVENLTKPREIFITYKP